MAANCIRDPYFDICTVAPGRRLNISMFASARWLGGQRLLAERDDLNRRSLSSTDAEWEADLKQLNTKLYTVAKAQFDELCPAVANGSRGSVVR